MNAQVKFPSPYELKAPKGAEGWRDLYPYYALFQEERKKGDEKQFWFCDAQHWPTPFRPFDTIMADYLRSSALANTTRATSSCRRPMASTTASTTATSI